MTQRARYALLLLGIILLAGSLAILAYATVSTETASLQVTLQPTVFMPP